MPEQIIHLLYKGDDVSLCLQHIPTPDDEALQENLRDDEGLVIDGCYRTIPTQAE